MVANILKLNRGLTLVYFLLGPGMRMRESPSTNQWDTRRQNIVGNLQ